MIAAIRSEAFGEATPELQQQELGGRLQALNRGATARRGVFSADEFRRNVARGGKWHSCLNMRIALNHARTRDGGGDTSRETALHVACGCSATSCVAALLDAGADVTLRDAYGRAPLHSAARSGNFDTVQKLLRAGAPAEAVNKYGRDAVYSACLSSDASEKLRIALLILNHQRVGPQRHATCPCSAGKGRQGAKSNRKCSEPFLLPRGIAGLLIYNENGNRP